MLNGLQDAYPLAGRLEQKSQMLVGMIKRTAGKLGLLCCAGFVCLVFCGGTILEATHANSVRDLGRIEAGPHPQWARFVVADLDGDREPDIALVEMQGQRSAAAYYSIRLRLSQGMASAVGVSGPMGGLRVAARDVNGDSSLDLILTSNLDSSFIQVLLNDGRGNFSLASPGEYAQAGNANGVDLHSPAGAQGDRVTLASVRVPHDGGVLAADEHKQIISSDVCPAAGAQQVLRKVTIARLGRSPPTGSIRS